MQTTVELKIGKIYFARTMSQKVVIPIAKSRSVADRYLFVSPGTPITPFVVWSVSQPAHIREDEIDLCQGQYYADLEGAILIDRDFFGADLNSIKSYLKKE